MDSTYFFGEFILQDFFFIDEEFFFFFGVDVVIFNFFKYDGVIFWGQVLVDDGIVFYQVIIFIKSYLFFYIVGKVEVSQVFQDLKKNRDEYFEFKLQGCYIWLYKLCIVLILF